ncbi:MAG TPA: hypothetical protein VI864_02650 [Candidatus Bathyarchaeia archaeon]|nr:hypothetical protein [Candidatus Bathyarchaeia archaeon]
MVDYCTIADVKSELPEIEGTTYDSELSGCVTSASAIVDSFLKKEDLTVPAVVPRNVKDATAYFAAWRFRRRRDPAGAEVFWIEANRFLDAYIDAEKAPYVGSA